jgi:U32 family peptidase
MRCEVLAPAGDRESLEAALSAGAEAVYFGLDEGFNARARASNFRVDGLSELVTQIHKAGARAYLALNTLIFQSELARVESILIQVAQSKVDAVIVQDPAVCLLAQRICPELEVHASTQMTISSAEASKFAETLGVTRVVVPRELSVDEIRKFRQGTDLELEVFVMGALCMAWSGQCLSSEAWGGRSANRGKCAQACRLPYSLVVDGETRELGDVQYLLSPKDLAGFRAVETLMEIGVHTLKIEGRQKGASYVHHAVKSLKNWRQAVIDGKQDPENLAQDLRDLSLVYSRGFGDGFLAGADHQTLVEGRTPRHRGVLLGRVEKVEKNRVLVGPRSSEKQNAEGQVSSPLPALGGSTEAATGAAVAAVVPRNGMGVVFRQGDEQESEQGGPIFSVKASQGDKWWLGFGRPGPDLRRVRPGAEVYLTSDPALAIKKVEQPEGRVELKVKVEGTLGAQLGVRAELPFGAAATARSTIALQEARKSALTDEVLQEQLGALGGTPFRLSHLSTNLDQNLFLPFAQLREMRRDLVDQLTLLLEQGKPREVHQGPHLPHLLNKPEPVPPTQTKLVALCRTEAQLEAALAAGVDEVELDWMELVGLNAPVAKAKAAGLKVGLATVRVQKPGEEAYDRRIEKLQPDSILVRHWAGLMHFLERQEEGPILHGDFSLNVTNSLTAHHLLKLGLQTITVSHDLDQKQLFCLLDALDPGRVAVTIHHHIPTFHTEHCVYSALLSNGRDFRTCGRPCEEHQVSLRDRVGHEHPVIVDVGCRNTVFNAQAQSAAFLVPDLMERGIARLRVEFVRETMEQAQTTLTAYQTLMRGQITHQELVERIDVHEQFGVTRGTMEVLS